MALIELEDGTLVEVEVPPEQAQQISGGGAFARVGTNLDRIQPLIAKTCRSVAAAWRRTHDELGKEMTIKNAEIELGLSFELEGNVYLAKSSTGANLKVKLVLEARPEETDKEGTEKAAQ